jgi:hypothetical protein
LRQKPASRRAAASSHAADLKSMTYLSDIY